MNLALFVLAFENKLLIQTDLMFVFLSSFLETAVSFRRKLTQANKEKFEQASKFNEDVSLIMKHISVYLCKLYWQIKGLKNTDLPHVI